MLYLLGGAARSGKSIIARRMLVEKSIPFFCLDHLAIGAAECFPQLQIDLDGDDAGVGESLWPLVKAVTRVILKDRIHYLLEGALLQPKHAHELIAEFPTLVRACFVGYAEIEIAKKFEYIKRYGGGPDDWMLKFDDAIIRSELERLRMVSRVLRDECQKYGLCYVDTSLGFDQALKEVMTFLSE